MSAPLIQDIDRSSATWARIEKYIVWRIEHHRNALEGNHDEVTTQQIRGRIRELRHLLMEMHPLTSTE